MMCEKCGKRVATTHIQTNINGVVESHHLCSQCAAESSRDQTQLGLNELLGSLFGETLKSTPRVDKRKRCPGCGMCFDDIAGSGRVGCDKCYETFLDQLMPSLQRMHGKAVHTGKTPAFVKREPTAEDKVAELKARLQQAVESENFEEAVRLRDEIKAIQDGEKNNE